MACDHPWLVIQGGKKANDSNVIRDDTSAAASATAAISGESSIQIKNGVRVVAAIGNSEVSEEENLSGLFGHAFLEGLMSKMLQRREARRIKEDRERRKQQQERSSLPVAQLNAALEADQALRKDQGAATLPPPPALVAAAPPPRQDAFVTALREQLEKSGGRAMTASSALSV